MKKITAIAARNTVSDDNQELLKKRRVCAYCRVSTDSLKQMESFETQVSYYESYIKSKTGWDYAGVFADEGISGTETGKRTEFNRMLKACELGKVDLIITKSISRFARNTTDCLEVVRYLKSFGVGVYFEKENINTLNADSEVILSILSSIAQDESRNISENVKWSIQKNFKKGEFKINTKRFLGYDMNDKGKIIVNKEEAEIVKKIYNRYLEGKSFKAIKLELEKDNIKTVLGNVLWSENTIKGILKNKKYYGDAILQKTITVSYLTKKKKKNKGQAPKYLIKCDHEPIVSKEDFLKVQDIMAKKALKYGNLFGDRDKYLQRYAFSGKIVCGNCGSVFKRRTWNSKLKSKQIVWQCSTYISKGKKYCAMKAVDDITLKAVFVRVFNKLYENKEEFFKAFIDNVQKVIRQSASCEVAFKIDREIKNINEEMKSLLRQQIKGQLKESTFDKKYVVLNEKLQVFKQQKDKLTYDDDKYKEVLKRNLEIKSFIEERKNTLTEFDDDIFENLIEKVVVITPTDLEFYFKNGMILEEKFIKKRGIKGLQ